MGQYIFRSFWLQLIGLYSVCQFTVNNLTLEQQRGGNPNNQGSASLCFYSSGHCAFSETRMIIHKPLLRRIYMLKMSLFHLLYGQRDSLVHICLKFSSAIILQPMGNTIEPSDFFLWTTEYCLWVYGKMQVCADKSETVDLSKENVRRIIANSWFPLRQNWSKTGTLNY